MSNAHILIVEDEDALVTLLRYNLEAEGFLVSVANDGEDIFDVDYTLQAAETTVAPDGNNFRGYRYLIGGDGGFTDQTFTQYQIKIVMRSNNSSAVPVFKDLRAIALAV